MLPALVAIVLAGALGAAAVALARVTSRGGLLARQADAGCTSSHSAVRDPANPLDLPAPPGPNPLYGAHFFVDGPRHGVAAGAIAQLLGVDPSRYPDGYSWARFKRSLGHGRFARLLARRPALRYRVRQLEKIGDQPEAQRFSVFSAGGGPGKIYAQVQKMFCYKLSADPGSVPIVSTYFLHPVVHSCPSPAELAGAAPEFKRRVDELVAATGTNPVVYLLEVDAYGSSSCMLHRGDLAPYEALIRYEVDRVAQLPHAVVYLEAGYSDSNSATYTARALNNSDIGLIRGFYTNDTHFNWTINEIRWANRVSRMTNGAHYVVNTAMNGNGPKRNPQPATQGNEDLCDPPGRALGPRTTTVTGFALVDAFLWTHPPGYSNGCRPGAPPSGTFWLARAISLAARANDRVGPRYASRRY